MGLGEQMVERKSLKILRKFPIKFEKFKSSLKVTFSHSPPFQKCPRKSPQALTHIYFSPSPHRRAQERAHIERRWSLSTLFLCHLELL